MSPQVEAAVIAASVGVLTLIATVVTQYLGEAAPGGERFAFRASREVRHTVIRVIAAHLKEAAAVSWQGLNLDFTGVVFDGGDFTVPGRLMVNMADNGGVGPADTPVRTMRR